MVDEVVAEESYGDDSLCSQYVITSTSGQLQKKRLYQNNGLASLFKFIKVKYCFTHLHYIVVTCDTGTLKASIQAAVLYPNYDMQFVINNLPSLSFLNTHDGYKNNFCSNKKRNCGEKTPQTNKNVIVYENIH